MATGFAIDKKSLEELRRLKEAAKRSRASFDADYWVNLAFFLNQQYSTWNTTKNTLVEVARLPGEELAPRPVINKIMHFTVKSHATACSFDPRPEVICPSTDAVIRSESRVAQSYIDDLRSPAKADWDTVKSDALMWAVTAGQSWLKWVYDDQLGRPSIIACSPFEVYCDPYVTRADLARYIIHAQFMDREQVYDRFGVEIPETETETRDPAKAVVLAGMGFEPKLSGVTVNELWQRPSRRYPEGRFVAWTENGTLLTPLTGKFPYEHMTLPFTQLGVVMVPGNLNHHAFTKFLRPPQMELNAVHAQGLVSRKSFANPKVFIDAEMAASLNEPWSDRPNQVLIGDTQGGSVSPPVIIQPSLMADNGFAEYVAAEMGDIVGQHSVSEGEAPGRVDSAKALELLKGEDTSHLLHLRQTLNMSTSKGFNMLLQLARQYVNEETIVSTYTRLGAPEVKLFKGEKITPEHAVRVAAEPAVPQSMAARQEEYLGWWTAGIITDPRQMQELLELPFAPGVSSEQDVLSATNENFSMLDEAPVTAHPWDDHDTHIAEHNSFRKSAEFQASTEETQHMFEFHIADHEQMWLDEMRKEAEKQAMVATFGAPPVDPAAVAADPNAPVDPTAPPATAAANPEE